MSLTALYDDSNPPLNAVQLMVSKVLMFHENIELIPSSDYRDLSPGNNDSSDCITIVLVVIPGINQLNKVDEAK